ncbi:MAG: hypothetical protein H7Y38_17055 [Armatimonadetes bacterium]|nr:hypothetical protein [Armatimonadota bacterium]
MKLNAVIDIGTDVASFYLFHPDDLKHRADDPLDWTWHDFSCEKEFLAGNLLAFSTGADGGYQLRLTSGDLTDAERAAQTGSWEFGYTVRHGRVLVDNGDFLPSDNSRSIKKAPTEQWVEIPNGDYRVLVHPIVREDDTLPDYVLRFEPVSAPLQIAKSATVPLLELLADAPPVGTRNGTADDVPKKATKPLEKTYPLLVEAGKYALPGGSASVAVPEKLFDAVRDEDDTLYRDGDFYAVLAPTSDAPCLATLVWVNGSSWSNLDGWKLKMQGDRLVRVVQVEPGELLPTAYIEEITPPDDPVGESERAALKEAFANSKTKTSGFERERIAATTTGEAVTERLIELVKMPVEKRFELYAAGNRERAEVLTEMLTKK